MPELVDAEDCFGLGMNYSSGAGVAVDLVQAHKWFNIAAMRGHRDGARHAQGNRRADERQRDRLRAARGARLAQSSSAGADPGGSAGHLRRGLIDRAARRHGSRFEARGSDRSVAGLALGRAFARLASPRRDTADCPRRYPPMPRTVCHALFKAIEAAIAGAAGTFFAKLRAPGIFDRGLCRLGEERHGCDGSRGAKHRTDSDHIESGHLESDHGHCPGLGRRVCCMIDNPPVRALVRARHI